jgi:hypothetical protein
MSGLAYVGNQLLLLGFDREPARLDQSSYGLPPAASVPAAGQPPPLRLVPAPLPSSASLGYRGPSAAATAAVSSPLGPNATQGAAALIPGYIADALDLPPDIQQTHHYEHSILGWLPHQTQHHIQTSLYPPPSATVTSPSSACSDTASLLSSLLSTQSPGSSTDHQFAEAWKSLLNYSPRDPACRRLWTQEQFPDAFQRHHLPALCPLPRPPLEFSRVPKDHADFTKLAHTFAAIGHASLASLNSAFTLRDQLAQALIDNQSPEGAQILHQVFPAIFNKSLLFANGTDAVALAADGSNLTLTLDRLHRVPVSHGPESEEFIRLMRPQPPTALCQV